MLTVPETAERLGRHPETVRRWIRSGRLRAHKVGTQHVIEEEDVAAMEREDTVALPRGWDRLSDGTTAPPWERLVREGRGGH